MKALVLAGGFPQIELIQEIKRRGYTVILADWNENPVAKAYADIYYQASTLDIDAIAGIAREEKVEFLITACTDQALLTVAKVSQMLNLPCYIDYQTALNVTNKAYMKRVFAENGISTAKFATMEALDEGMIAGMEYPLIVKPVDCNSSKGVKKVTNPEELKAAFAEAVTYSRTNNAIIEEFIEGPELSVDVYVEDGKAHVLCISCSEKIPDKDKFVIFRGRWPAKEADGMEEIVARTAQQIADAFGLKNSPMLIQMITDGKRAYVLEFSARTGGGVKYLMIRKASGFDVIKAVVDLTLGLKPHVGPLVSESRFVVNEFIYCFPGVFDHLEGFDELKESGIISDYYLFKWKGADFDSVNNSGDRVAGFTLQAETIEELKTKHDAAIRGMKVIAENGDNIMRYDLLGDIN